MKCYISQHYVTVLGHILPMSIPIRYVEYFGCKYNLDFSDSKDVFFRLWGNDASKRGKVEQRMRRAQETFVPPGDRMPMTKAQQGNCFVVSKTVILKRVIRRGQISHTLYVLLDSHFFIPGNYIYMCFTTSNQYIFADLELRNVSRFGRFDSIMTIRHIIHGITSINLVRYACPIRGMWVSVGASIRQQGLCDVAQHYTTARRWRMLIIVVMNFCINQLLYRNSALKSNEYF